MDGWAHPNVAVQPGSECVRRCRCSAECCWRLMGGGGHIVSAPTKSLGPVCICRDFVIWHSVNGADWVEAGHRAQHGHSNSVQNTLRDRCGDARVWVGSVRACLRPGTYHVLVLMELRRICRMGAQGDGSLLNALSRKCYMHMLQYVHRGTLP